MGQIEIRVASRYSECSLAVYHDDDNEQFNVVFHKELKNGKEEINIILIEKDGTEIPYAHPVWERVKQALQKKAQTGGHPSEQR